MGTGLTEATLALLRPRMATSVNGRGYAVSAECETRFSSDAIHTQHMRSIGIDQATTPGWEATGHPTH